MEEGTKRRFGAYKTRTFGSRDVTSPSFVRVWAVGLPARQDCEARPVQFHISLSTKQ